MATRIFKWTIFNTSTTPYRLQVCTFSVLNYILMYNRYVGTFVVSQRSVCRVKKFSLHKIFILCLELPDTNWNFSRWEAIFSLSHWTLLYCFSNSKILGSVPSSITFRGEYRILSSFTVMWCNSLKYSTLANHHYESIIYNCTDVCERRIG